MNYYYYNLSNIRHNKVWYFLSVIQVTRLSSLSGWVQVLLRQIRTSKRAVIRLDKKQKKEKKSIYETKFGSCIRKIKPQNLLFVKTRFIHNYWKNTVTNKCRLQQSCWSFEISNLWIMTKRLWKPHIPKKTRRKILTGNWTMILHNDTT